MSMLANLPGESVPSVVHDAAKVVHLAQGVHLVRVHLQEVVLLPCSV